MLNSIVSSAVSLIMMLAWARSATSAAPRQDPDAGAGAALLRRETSEMESYEVPDGQISANFKSEMSRWDPGSEHESPNRGGTSFLLNKMMKRLSSTSKRMSKTAGQTPTPNPAHFSVHSCGNDDSKCDFMGCRNNGGRVAACHYDNCYMRNVADTTTCAGLPDGTEVPPDEFCVDEIPIKMCPSKGCKDIDGRVAGTTCSELLAADAGFCENMSLQAVIETFCPFTCKLCAGESTADELQSVQSNSSENGTSSSGHEEKKKKRFSIWGWAKALLFALFVVVAVGFLLSFCYEFTFQAWLITFVSVCEIVFLTPFCICSEYAKWRVDELVQLVKFCWQGLDRWTAAAFFLLGLHIFTTHSAQPLVDFAVPSEQIDKKYPIEIRTNENLAETLSFDFLMGAGDYDYWRSKLVRDIVRTYLRFINSWYALPGPGKKAVTKEEANSYVKEVIEFGANPDIGPARSLVEPFSADGAKRFCTLGYGALFLRRDEEGGGYMVDMTMVEPFEVREGFHKYGGKLVLDKDMNFQHLILFGRKFLADDPEFQGAMYIFRSTTMLPGIFVMHTCWCHYFNGGWVATVLRKHIPPAHPIRRVLAPFTCGTIAVNAGAQDVITARCGILTRYSSLTPEGQDKVCQMCTDLNGHFAWKFQSYAEELRERGVDGLSKDAFPYGYFGLKLSKIYESFADAYVNFYWPTKADVKRDAHLQTFFREYHALFPKGYAAAVPEYATSPSEVSLVISQHLWKVTAVHEQTGRTDADWEWGVCTPMAAKRGEKLTLDNILPSACTRLGLYFVQAMVHAPGPKLCQSDLAQLTRFFPDDCPLSITAKFEADLISLTHEILEYNLTAPEPVEMLYPPALECSVTV